jgi:hypothetical protein
MCGYSWQQRDPTKTRSWTGQIEIILLAVLIAALFVPAPERFTAPWMGSVRDLAHVPLFAGVTWALQRVMGGRMIPAAVTALAMTVIAELLQSFVGRSASLADVARGTCGIVFFVGWNLAEQGSTAWRRRAARLACLLIGAALPLAGAWPTLADSIVSWWEFPLLADFSSPWEDRRWTVEGCRLTCGPGAGGEGIGILQCESGGQPHPSIILFPIRRDWSIWRSLQVEFTVEGGPLPITLSLRDGRRVTPPQRRFDWNEVYQEGRHRVGLDLAEVARGSDQVAPIDVGAVESFHFILNVEGVSRVVRLHRIYLE